MTSLEHLLPAADQAVRCAEHSRDLGIDPGGTAIRADRVILIETPLPWPKPVFDHALLAEVAPILTKSIVPTRTLAAVPAEGADDRAPYPAVVTYDREADGVVERRFNVRTPEQLVGVAQALAANDLDTVDALADETGRLDTPVVLICTQGSHDVCCGSEGARFAAEAEQMSGVSVYRVSHTGGHRFAPTAMTLPDGRMWADLDLDLLRQILARAGATSGVVDRCRGWWGADTGPAQVAERAVFELVGWELDDLPRIIELGETQRDSQREYQLEARPGGVGSTVCTVSAGDRSWQVEVSVGRTVPTIACREPGGLPAKPATEFQASAVTELHR